MVEDDADRDLLSSRNRHLNICASAVGQKESAGEEGQGLGSGGLTAAAA